MEAADGSRAELTREGDVERIAVRDRRGELIFEYEPASGRARLSVPEGDLTLAAPRGDVVLLAGKAIRSFAAGEIALDSGSAVSLRARGEGATTAGVRVAPGEIRMAAPALELAAERARLRIADGRYEGARFSALVDRAHVALGTLETVAERVITRAGTLMQRVTELYEQRAGRMRIAAQRALHMSAESATLLAEDDVRIDGTKINLG